MTPYYSDEACVIYHGDCLSVLPILQQVDHVITDPPYGDHVHGKQWVSAALTKGRSRFGGNGASKELGFEALTSEMRLRLATESARLSRRWVLEFSDIEGASEWRSANVAAGLEHVRTCIWVKPDASPQFSGDRPGAGAEAIVVSHRPGRKNWNGGGHRGVFAHCVNDYGRTERAHPSPKPEPLMRELVELFTDRGDLILDPFGGSGTTAVAAKRLGRRCILIEQEEKYCEVAAQRLRQSALDLFGTDPPAVNGALEL